jgi:cell division protein FtsW
MSPKPGHSARARSPAGSRKGSRPVEHSLLLTATLCLLAFGVVMVFSASSTTALLGESGDGAYYLKRTALFGALGLLIMHALSVHGARAMRTLTPLVLVGTIALLCAVLVPGIGEEANGARRWIGAGLIQVQPSEIAKLALILFGANLLALRPKLSSSLGSMAPFLAVVALVCGLVVIQPDLGTAVVCMLAVSVLLLAAGARIRDLALIAAGLAAVVLLMVAVEPYRMDRLTGFLNPGMDPGGSGFQAIQAKIALGSGGILGVGLGESVQKAFYLPEAHTDMIAAVIGEELGLIGIVGLAGLYGVLGYAGLRIAQRARDRYGKLLAAGLTSLILVQAVVNLFAVLGLAPLTGVPLPFVSYGNSSMIVMLSAVGLLLNISRGGTVGMRASSPRTASSRRADSRPRSSRAGGGGRPARRRVGDVGRLRTGGSGSEERPTRPSRSKQRSTRGVDTSKDRDRSRGNRRSRGSRARGRRRAAG